VPIEDVTKQQVLAEHPGALTVTIPATNYDDEFECMVKRPPRGEWKRFRAMSSDEAQRSEALEMLTKACIVHPPLPEFMKLLDQRPGLTEAIGAELVEVAGLVQGASTKK
jgi:hypothetical protein